MVPSSRKSRRRLAGLSARLAALFIALVSFAAFAQRADGNIGGDAAPGDRIHVQNLGTGWKRDAVADEDGNYRFRSVPLGDYQVRITRGADELVLNAVVTVRPGGTARPPKPAADAAAAPAPAPAPPGN